MSLARTSPSHGSRTGKAADPIPLFNLPCDACLRGDLERAKERLARTSFRTCSAPQVVTSRRAYSERLGCESGANPARKQQRNVALRGDTETDSICNHCEQKS